MLEKESFPENRLPAILDIIKLDGRWAQILAPAANDTLIRYLDDGSTLNINFSDYKLERSIDLDINCYEIVHRTEFPLKAQEKVFYDAEVKDPKLKKLVNIHGFYVKKLR